MHIKQNLHNDIHLEGCVREMLESVKTRPLLPNRVPFRGTRSTLNSYRTARHHTHGGTPALRKEELVQILNKMRSKSVQMKGGVV